MVIKVRFCTLVGKFVIGETKEFPDMKAATESVKAYAATHGFTKVKIADDDDDFGNSLRFTCTTPNGRAGRNVAFAEDGSDDFY
jgi:hypothetical protein